MADPGRGPDADGPRGPDPDDVPAADPEDKGLDRIARVLDESPRFAFRLLPFVVFLGLVGTSALIYPVRTRGLGGLYIAYFLPPLGKESVVPILVSQGFHPLFAAGAIATMDLVGALIVFANWDLVVRIPVVGGWLADFGDRISQVGARQGVVKAGRWVFLFLFVMFPLQGSGGISGALISRILGISMARALLIIGSAAFVSALVIGVFSEAIISLVGPEVLLGAVAVVAAVIGIRYLLGIRDRVEEE